MKAIVNLKQRHAKMRAHTATHLLHAAIGKFFPHTKQAGSLVDEDYLRFDFTADALLTQAQLKELEELVNHRIALVLPVVTQVQSYEEAIAGGAKAFFEDKYDDDVRVVTIKDGVHAPISLELCGGTHVENTAHIGAMKIIEHGSVASGVKRIVAYTGPKVANHALMLQEKIYAIAAHLESKPAHIEQKIEKNKKEKKELSEELSRLQTGQITSLLATMSSSHDFFDVLVDVSKEQALQGFPFKTIVQKAKEYFADKKVCVYNKEGNFALLGVDAKSFAQQHSLKGGGSDTFVQGRDLQIIEVFG